MQGVGHDLLDMCAMDATSVLTRGNGVQASLRRLGSIKRVTPGMWRRGSRGIETRLGSHDVRTVSPIFLRSRRKQTVRLYHDHKKHMV
ncbi:hypothetical protein M3J09_011406 [Ascochyta lentis]